MSTEWNVHVGERSPKLLRLTQDNVPDRPSGHGQNEQPVSLNNAKSFLISTRSLSPIDARSCSLPVACPLPGMRCTTQGPFDCPTKAYFSAATVYPPTSNACPPTPKAWPSTADAPAHDISRDSYKQHYTGKEDSDLPDGGPPDVNPFCAGALAHPTDDDTTDVESADIIDMASVRGIDEPKKDGDKAPPALASQNTIRDENADADGDKEGGASAYVSETYVVTGRKLVVIFT